MNIAEIKATKPNQEQLTITIEVVEWFQSYLKEYEPHATVAVSACQEILDNIPFNVDDIVV